MRKEFVKSLNNGKVEGQLIKTLFISLITSFIVLALFYFIKLKSVPDFLPKYGFFIFFSVLSYAIIMPAIRQVRSYKLFPCMSGMMIGMTIGMISGFLPGFYIGATNGMFWGSVFGMVVGIFLGIWNGSCCGVMGAMEGIMAGFMGALMGAMTSVMMLNDNLKAASMIVFGVSAFIVIGLNYMIFKETRETEIQKQEDSFLTILLSAILTALTVWLMVFGPRSFLFAT